MSNIKVAVRVRPLNDREIASGKASIVQVSGNTVSIFNPKIPLTEDGADHRQRWQLFTYDYAYDGDEDDSEVPLKNTSRSLDFKNDESLQEATTQDRLEVFKNLEQEKIHNDIGTIVENAAIDGINACLFAYGQSGSGKTYTILGTKESPGLAPRICRSLLQRLKDRWRDIGQEDAFSISISLVEIYKERARDLLSYENPKKILQIREHPASGPYIDGVRWHQIQNLKMAWELLERGRTCRIVAPTAQHSQSSRSHALLRLNVFQPYSGTKSSVTLVDLAGSERIHGDVDKDRLSEGSYINRSLLTLGSVISALADRNNSSSPTPYSSHSSLGSSPTQGEKALHRGHHAPSPSLPFIPYRDSVLTWLLRDTLGGNAETIMIATLSPSNNCFSENLATLRYATRARRIVNTPVVNLEVPALKREREDSLCTVEKITKSLSAKQGTTFADRKMREGTRDGTQSRQSISKSAGSEYRMRDVLVQSELPYIMNTTDDLFSSTIIIYHLKVGSSVLGTGKEADLFVPGEDVAPEHCTFIHFRRIVTLRTHLGLYIKLNGVKLGRGRSKRLQSGDIIEIGNRCFAFYSATNRRKWTMSASSLERSLNVDYKENANVESLSSPHRNQSERYVIGCSNPGSFDDRASFSTPDLSDSAKVEGKLKLARLPLHKNPERSSRYTLMRMKRKTTSESTIELCESDCERAFNERSSPIGASHSEGTISAWAQETTDLEGDEYDELSFHSLENNHIIYGSNSSVDSSVSQPSFFSLDSHFYKSNKSKDYIPITSRNFFLDLEQGDRRCASEVTTPVNSPLSPSEARKRWDRSLWPEIEKGLRRNLSVPNLDLNKCHASEKWKNKTKSGNQNKKKIIEEVIKRLYPGSKGHSERALKQKPKLYSPEPQTEYHNEPGFTSSDRHKDYNKRVLQYKDNNRRHSFSSTDTKIDNYEDIAERETISLDENVIKMSSTNCLSNYSTFSSSVDKNCEVKVANIIKSSSYSPLNRQIKSWNTINDNSMSNACDACLPISGFSIERQADKTSPKLQDRNVRTLTSLNKMTLAERSRIVKHPKNLKTDDAFSDDSLETKSGNESQKNKFPSASETDSEYFPKDSLTDDTYDSESAADKMTENPEYNQSDYDTKRAPKLGDKNDSFMVAFFKSIGHFDIQEQKNGNLSQEDLVSNDNQVLDINAENSDVHSPSSSNSSKKYYRLKTKQQNLECSSTEDSEPDLYQKPRRRKKNKKNDNLNPDKQNFTDCTEGILLNSSFNCEKTLDIQEQNISNALLSSNMVVKTKENEGPSLSQINKLNNHDYTPASETSFQPQHEIQANLTEKKQNEKQDSDLEEEYETALTSSYDSVISEQWHYDNAKSTETLSEISDSEAQCIDYAQFTSENQNILSQTQWNCKESENTLSNTEFESANNFSQSITYITEKYSLPVQDQNMFTIPPAQRLLYTIIECSENSRSEGGPSESDVIPDDWRESCTESHVSDCEVSSVSDDTLLDTVKSCQEEASDSLTIFSDGMSENVTAITAHNVQDNYKFSQEEPLNTEHEKHNSPELYANNENKTIILCSQSQVTKDCNNLSEHLENKNQENLNCMLTSNIDINMRQRDKNLPISNNITNNKIAEELANDQSKECSLFREIFYEQPIKEPHDDKNDNKNCSRDRNSYLQSKIKSEILHKNISLENQIMFDSNCQLTETQNKNKDTQNIKYNANKVFEDRLEKNSNYITKNFVSVTKQIGNKDSHQIFTNDNFEESSDAQTICINSRPIKMSSKDTEYHGIEPMSHKLSAYKTELHKFEEVKPDDGIYFDSNCIQLVPKDITKYKDFYENEMDDSTMFSPNDLINNGISDHQNTEQSFSKTYNQDSPLKEQNCPALVESFDKEHENNNKYIEDCSNISKTNIRDRLEENIFIQHKPQLQGNTGLASEDLRSPLSIQASNYSNIIKHLEETNYKDIECCNSERIVIPKNLENATFNNKIICDTCTENTKANTYFYTPLTDIIMQDNIINDSVKQFTTLDNTVAIHSKSPISLLTHSNQEYANIVCDVLSQDKIDNQQKQLLPTTPKIDNTDGEKSILGFNNPYSYERNDEINLCQGQSSNGIDIEGNNECNRNLVKSKQLSFGQVTSSESNEIQNSKIKQKNSQDDQSVYEHTDYLYSANKEKHIFSHGDNYNESHINVLQEMQQFQEMELNLRSENEIKQNVSTDSKNNKIVENKCPNADARNECLPRLHNPQTALKLEINQTNVVADKNISKNAIDPMHNTAKTKIPSECTNSTKKCTLNTKFQEKNNYELKKLNKQIWQPLYVKQSINKNPNNDIQNDAIPVTLLNFKQSDLMTMQNDTDKIEENNTHSELNNINNYTFDFATQFRDEQSKFQTINEKTAFIKAKSLQDIREPTVLMKIKSVSWDCNLNSFNSLSDINFITEMNLNKCYDEETVSGNGLVQNAHKMQNTKHKDTDNKKQFARAKKGMLMKSKSFIQESIEDLIISEKGLERKNSNNDNPENNFLKPISLTDIALNNAILCKSKMHTKEYETTPQEFDSITSRCQEVQAPIESNREYTFNDSSNERSMTIQKLPWTKNTTERALQHFQEHDLIPTNNKLEKCNHFEKNNCILDIQQLKTIECSLKYDTPYIPVKHNSFQHAISNVDESIINNNQLSNEFSSGQIVTVCEKHAVHNNKILLPTVTNNSAEYFQNSTENQEAIQCKIKEENGIESLKEIKKYNSILFANTEGNLDPESKENIYCLQEKEVINNCSAMSTCCLLYQADHETHNADCNFNSLLKLGITSKAKLLNENVPNLTIIDQLKNRESDNRNTENVLLSSNNIAQRSFIHNQQDLKISETFSNKTLLDNENITKLNSIPIKNVVLHTNAQPDITRQSLEKALRVNNNTNNLSDKMQCNEITFNTVTSLHANHEIPEQIIDKLSNEYIMTNKKSLIQDSANNNQEIESTTSTGFIGDSPITFDSSLIKSVINQQLNALQLKEYNRITPCQYNSKFLEFQGDQSCSNKNSSSIINYSTNNETIPKQENYTVLCNNKNKAPSSESNLSTNMPEISLKQSLNNDAIQEMPKPSEIKQIIPNMNLCNEETTEISIGNCSNLSRFKSVHPISTEDEHNVRQLQYINSDEKDKHFCNTFLNSTKNETVNTSQLQYALSNEKGRPMSNTYIKSTDDDNVNVIQSYNAISDEKEKPMHNICFESMEGENLKVYQLPFTLTNKKDKSACNISHNSTDEKIKVSSQLHHLILNKMKNAQDIPQEHISSANILPIDNLIKLSEESKLNLQQINNGTLSKSSDKASEFIKLNKNTLQESKLYLRNSDEIVFPGENVGNFDEISFYGQQDDEQKETVYAQKSVTVMQHHIPENKNDFQTISCNNNNSNIFSNNEVVIAELENYNTFTPNSPQLVGNNEFGKTLTPKENHFHRQMLQDLGSFGKLYDSKLYDNHGNLIQSTCKKATSENTETLKEAVVLMNEQDPGRLMQTNDDTVLTYENTFTSEILVNTQDNNLSVIHYIPERVNLSKNVIVSTDNINEINRSENKILNTIPKKPNKLEVEHLEHCASRSYTINKEKIITESQKVEENIKTKNIEPKFYTNKTVSSVNKKENQSITDIEQKKADINYGNCASEILESIQIDNSLSINSSENKISDPNDVFNDSNKKMIINKNTGITQLNPKYDQLKKDLASEEQKCNSINFTYKSDNMKAVPVNDTIKLDKELTVFEKQISHNGQKTMDLIAPQHSECSTESISKNSQFYDNYENKNTEDKAYSMQLSSPLGPKYESKQSLICKIEPDDMLLLETDCMKERTTKQLSSNETNREVTYNSESYKEQSDFHCLKNHISLNSSLNNVPETHCKENELNLQFIHHNKPKTRNTENDKPQENNPTQDQDCNNTVNYHKDMHSTDNECILLTKESYAENGSTNSSKNTMPVFKYGKKYFKSSKEVNIKSASNAYRYSMGTLKNDSLPSGREVETLQNTNQKTYYECPNKKKLYSSLNNNLTENDINTIYKDMLTVTSSQDRTPLSEGSINVTINSKAYIVTDHLQSEKETVGNINSDKDISNYITGSNISKQFSLNSAAKSTSETSAIDNKAESNSTEIQTHNNESKNINKHNIKYFAISSNVNEGPIENICTNKNNSKSTISDTKSKTKSLHSVYKNKNQQIQEAEYSSKQALKIFNATDSNKNGEKECINKITNEDITKQGITDTSSLLKEMPLILQAPSDKNKLNLKDTTITTANGNSSEASSLFNKGYGPCSDININTESSSVSDNNVQKDTTTIASNTSWQKVQKLVKSGKVSIAISSSGMKNKHSDEDQTDISSKLKRIKYSHKRTYTTTCNNSKDLSVASRNCSQKDNNFQSRNEQSNATKFNEISKNEWPNIKENINNKAHTSTYNTFLHDSEKGYTSYKQEKQIRHNPHDKKNKKLQYIHGDNSTYNSVMNNKEQNKNLAFQNVKSEVQFENAKLSKKEKAEASNVDLHLPENLSLEEYMSSTLDRNEEKYVNIRNDSQVYAKASDFIKTSVSIDTNRDTTKEVTKKIPNCNSEHLLPKLIPNRISAGSQVSINSKHNKRLMKIMCIKKIDNDQQNYTYINKDHQRDEQFPNWELNRHKKNTVFMHKSKPYSVVICEQKKKLKHRYSHRLKKSFSLDSFFAEVDKAKRYNILKMSSSKSADSVVSNITQQNTIPKEIISSGLFIKKESEQKNLLKKALKDRSLKTDSVNLNSAIKNCNTTKSSQAYMPNKKLNSNTEKCNIPKQSHKKKNTNNLHKQQQFLINQSSDDSSDEMTQEQKNKIAKATRLQKKFTALNTSIEKGSIHLQQNNKPKNSLKKHITYLDKPRKEKTYFSKNSFSEISTDGLSERSETSESPYELNTRQNSDSEPFSAPATPAQERCKFADEENTFLHCKSVENLSNRNDGEESNTWLALSQIMIEAGKLLRKLIQIKSNFPSNSASYVNIEEKVKSAILTSGKTHSAVPTKYCSSDDTDATAVLPLTTNDKFNTTQQMTIYADDNTDVEESLRKELVKLQVEREKLSSLTNIIEGYTNTQLNDVSNENSCGSQLNKENKQALYKYLPMPVKNQHLPFSGIIGVNKKGLELYQNRVEQTCSNFNDRIKSKVKSRTIRAKLYARDYLSPDRSTHFTNSCDFPTLSSTSTINLDAVYDFSNPSVQKEYPREPSKTCWRIPGQALTNCSKAKSYSNLPTTRQSYKCYTQEPTYMCDSDYLERRKKIKDQIASIKKQLGNPKINFQSSSSFGTIPLQEPNYISENWGRNLAYNKQSVSLNDLQSARPYVPRSWTNRRPVSVTSLSSDLEFKFQRAYSESQSLSYDPSDEE